MSIELAGAIAVAIAAYIIGRLSGRRAEAREREGHSGHTLDGRVTPRTSMPPRHHASRRQSQPVGRMLTDEDIAHIRDIAMSGRKIEAIKQHREMTGVGLKESKDYVESLMR